MDCRIMIRTRIVIQSVLFVTGVLALLQPIRAAAQYHFIAPPAGADPLNLAQLNGISGTQTVGTYTDLSGMQHGFTYGIRSSLYTVFDATNAVQGTTGQGIKEFSRLLLQQHASIQRILV